MFEETRPYNDNEIPAAIERVANHPFFNDIVRYLFPERVPEDFRKEFLSIQSTYEFQHKVMLSAIHNIIRRTSTGLSEEGFQLLEKGRCYMFIANHRDILLDAAILQILLDKYGLDTSEITFGNNLMQGQLATDLGKMNKMFKISRSGTMLDFYKSSVEVSSYMRYAILQKRQSTWIAQRNGRTKDGEDITNSAVLKMFSISSDKNFTENLSELNITPLVISYEYEPCDFLKTQELYISRYQKYVKKPDEDMNSIQQGVLQSKGKIHLAVTPTITKEELDTCERLDKRDRFNQLAKIIDQRIYGKYKLWTTNYIAYDLLHQCSKYENIYTPSEKLQFIQYMQEGLEKLQGDKKELANIFLGIYANPVSHCS